MTSWPQSRHCRGSEYLMSYMNKLQPLAAKAATDSPKLQGLCHLELAYCGATLRNNEWPKAPITNNEGNNTMMNGPQPSCVRNVMLNGPWCISYSF